MGTLVLRFDSIHVSYLKDQVIHQTRNYSHIEEFLDDMKRELEMDDFYKMIVWKEKEP